MTNPNADIFFELLQFERLLPYTDELIDGFLMTMGLYVFALSIGFFLGLFLAIGRQYGGGISSRVSTGFIEIIRGTPLLAQVFFIYFAPPALNTFFELMGYPRPFNDWQILGPDLWGGTTIIISSRILLGAIALALNSAAYQAEYIRGAMGSISSGQLQAAISMGMTKTQSIRYIILPQSLRRVIPSWSNEAAYLPKYTTVVSFIAIEELFAVSSWVVTRTFIYIEIWIVIALVFLALISTISFALDKFYARVKIPGL